MSIAIDRSTTTTIDYPERDGKPLGETDVHRREIAQIIDMLMRFFRNVADCYVSGNLMFYYEEGNPSKVISPDVFVVRGVPKGLRRTYKLWEEKLPPVIVFEITSRSTRREDLTMKRVLYAQLGIREYVLFDPLAEYLTPPLQGFRLVGDEYLPIETTADGALISEELNLRMLREGSFLRLIDLATGQPLLRPEELDAARLAAEEQAASESVARLAAEEQTTRESAARLAAEEQAASESVARLAAEEQTTRESAARLAAEEQAASESVARLAAEEEIARLRAELARLRGGSGNS